MIVCGLKKITLTKQTIDACKITSYGINKNRRAIGTEMTSSNTTQSRIRYASRASSILPIENKNCVPIPVYIRLEGPTNSVTKEKIKIS